MKNKQPGTFATIYHYARECRVKMLLSVLCALVSVTGGLIPYWGVYRILLLFFDKVPEVKDILFWTGICAGGYVIKLLFYGISTTLSHMSAYQILENIRLAITKKLMKAPLGAVISQTAGKLKNIIVDRVETIELPLAHMIPEGISNLLLPVAVFAYMLLMVPMKSLPVRFDPLRNSPWHGFKVRGNL
ncbi:MAG: hypothetical protein K0R50_3047 [Eubacterium sp.]|nr:hypothetical protein [Eubacterium sp.]